MEYLFINITTILLKHYMANHLMVLYAYHPMSYLYSLGISIINTFPWCYLYISIALIVTPMHCITTHMESHYVWITLGCIYLPDYNLWFVMRLHRVFLLVVPRGLTIPWPHDINVWNDTIYIYNVYNGWAL